MTRIPTWLVLMVAVALMGCGGGEDGKEDILTAEDTASTDEGMVASCPALAPFGNGPCTGTLTCYYLAWQTCGPGQFDICTCQYGLWTCMLANCPLDPGPDIQELSAVDVLDDALVCPAEKPYLLPDSGTCVECLDSTQCDPELQCDLETHECLLPPCPGDGHRCEDGLCHQCCEDADCGELVSCGGAPKCWDHTCGGAVDPCCGSCAKPYPVCTDVGGTWQCVACTEDSHCFDYNTCTVDSCDMMTFTCLHDTLDCEDHNVCTLDWCDPADDDGSPCQHDIVECDDDGDPCTKDYCHFAFGCVHPPIKCDDGVLCTKDTCVDGTCQYDEIAGCEQCHVSYLDPDTCQCAKKPKCDDGKWWTWDECDPVTGECSFPLRCEYPPTKTCDEENDCAQECVDVSTGECYFIGGCDDDDLCTVDSCDPATGECRYDPIVCESDNPCIESLCNPYDGQCYPGKKNECENPCYWVGTCNEDTGICQYNVDIDPIPSPCGHCCMAPEKCVDQDPCMLSVGCDPEFCLCKWAPPDCDDHDCLTKDWCDPNLITGGCKHEPVPLLVCPPEA